MEIINNITELRRYRADLRRQGRSLGLVPTMGAIHSGHTSLVELAAQQADAVLVWIFVNRAQFNDQSDFERYPRDFKGDCEILQKHGVSAVLIPDEQEIFQPGYQTWIEPGELAVDWEGKFRPGHFRGVATIVAMMFAMIEPELAVFGEKDFQQLRIVEQLVADLKFNVEIIRAPIVRDPDGLALSSRNQLLSDDERNEALTVPRSIKLAQEAFLSGERRTNALCRIAEKAFNGTAAKPEYFVIVDPVTLKETEIADANSRVLVAARVGSVRLIDNAAIGGG
ncbi:MAG: pantoate--beta-alanine ligase [Candidatus Dadabacteria bacterium]|nr:MAG: pantoate--beta-alanine ligase [Candidatus Dadabacteria bacterium]